MPTQKISADDTATLSSATIIPVVTPGTPNANERTTLASLFANRVVSAAGTPTTTQFPTGTWGIHHNSSNGDVKLVYNLAGVLKTVALS